MRFLTYIFLVIIGVSCSNTKNAAPGSYQEKPNKLNGTWVPVKQEMGGTLLPIVENQKLIIDDSTYTVVAESIDKGIVKYRDDKMDIYGKEGVNAGKHFTAIYKYENDQLTVCYNLSDDNYPEKFETKGKPMYFLSIFKKEMIK